MCLAVLLNSCKKSNPEPPAIVNTDISFKVDGVEKKINSISVVKYPLPSGDMVQILAKNGNEDFTLQIFNPSAALSDGEISYNSDNTKPDNALTSDGYSNYFTNSDNITITSNNSDGIAGTFYFFVTLPNDVNVVTISEGKFNCKFTH